MVLKHRGRKLWNIGYIFCKIESIDILFYPKLNCKSKAARCRSINWKSILNHRYARKILRMREFCCRHYDYHYYTVSSSLLLLLCQLLKHLRGGSSTYIAKMIWHFVSFLLGLFYFEPCKPQYPETNSPNWSLYISLKNVFREFDERSKQFLFDHFYNSHNLISWQCIGIIRRKLMSVTIGT